MPPQNGDVGESVKPEDLEADIRAAANQRESSEELREEAEDAVDTFQAETVDRPPGRDEGIPQSKTYDPLSFPVVVLLMPASVFGVLARLGLTALMNYKGHSVFPLAYPQAVGCLVMGFGLGLKDHIGQFYAPLYTAITTGFCGSLTTFSSWQLDVFSAWINTGGYQRSGFSDFLDGVGLSTVTLSLSLASLLFGRRLAKLFTHRLEKPQFLPPTARYGLSSLAILVYAATFPTYFVLPSKYRHQATAALLFSFPGTFTRYILSIILNRRLKALPLGTLSANTLGTALLATFHVLQSTHAPPSYNACNVLQGLMDGFCGCLTTVSTFAAELSDFKFGKACRYALVSWVLGQIMMVLIFGSSVWTGSVEKHVTCRFP